MKMKHTLPARERILSMLEPVREVTNKLSPRTWVVVCQGAIVVALSTRLFGVNPAWQLPVLGAYFVLCILTLWTDLHPSQKKIPWVTIVTLAWIVIIVISHLASVSKLHLDEALFTESALESIVEGINPYARSYTGTLVDRWTEFPIHGSFVHPSADHYIYFPLNLVVSLPFYALSRFLGIVYDQRVVYFLAFLGLFLLLWRALKRSPHREAITLSVALSPFIAFMLYTYNDLLTLLILAASSLALVRRRMYLAAGFYGLSLVAKQYMVLTIPFFIPLLLRLAGEHKAKRIFTLAAVVIPFTVVLLPFFLWSPGNFIDDTVMFFFGGTYPITGVGFSGLLLDSGAVERTDAFPFWMFQLAISLPTFLILLRWSFVDPSLYRTLTGMALGIAVFWFFSRYFMPAHVATIVSILMLALVMREVEQTSAA